MVNFSVNRENFVTPFPLTNSNRFYYANIYLPVSQYAKAFHFYKNDNWRDEFHIGSGGAFKGVIDHSCITKPFC